MRIDRACTWLEALASREPETVLASEQSVSALERMLEVAAMAAIDVAIRVIAVWGFRTPASYREGFDVLHREGLLDPELAGQMRVVAELRDALAHDYLDIEPRRLLASLPADISALRAFCVAAAGWLQQGGVHHSGGECVSAVGRARSGRR